MTVPSGSSEFTADEVLPGFNYLYGWDINEEWSTGGSTGINGAIDDETLDSYTRVIAVVDGRPLVDRAHRQLRRMVRARADERRHEPHRELLQRRLHVLFNNDLQWDIRAGVGLNEAADDFFAGTGLSFRYW